MTANPHQSSERQRSRSGPIATVAVMLAPIWYLLALGPITWVTPYLPEGLSESLTVIYYPLAWCLDRSPPLVADLIYWWLFLGIPDWAGAPPAA